MPKRESFDAYMARIRRENDERSAKVLAAWKQSPAIIVKYKHREELLLLSPEPSNPEEGPMRVTFLTPEGPRGHEVGTVEKLAASVGSTDMVSLRPATEAEVIAWTSTPEYELGAKAVAFTQADNEIRYLASRLGRMKEIQDVRDEAHKLFRSDPDAAITMLHKAIAELSAPSGEAGEPGGRLPPMSEARDFPTIEQAASGVQATAIETNGETAWLYWKQREGVFHKQMVYFVEGKWHVSGRWFPVREIPASARPVEAAKENPVADPAIPWVKVTRDPEQYAKAIELAKEVGPIENSEDVYQLLEPALSKEDQEVFVVVLMDVRRQLRGVAEVARGARSSVTVPIADVMRVVVSSGAETFVVCHNHPSTKADPSDSDRKLTKDIEEAFKPLGADVTFADHVVIGMGEYYSFADRKLHRAKKRKT